MNTNIHPDSYREDPGPSTIALDGGCCGGLTDFGCC